MGRHRLGRHWTWVQLFDPITRDMIGRAFRINLRGGAFGR